MFFLRITKVFILGMILTISTNVMLLFGADSKLTLNAPAPEVTLAKGEGGFLDGSPWSSSSLKEKVHVVFYVDPDASTDNDNLADALREKHFSAKDFGSIAIINMAATWKPNFAINSVLADKQKTFPRTKYIKDYEKKIVRSWGVADDANNVLVFGRKGELLFYHSGKLSENEVKELVAMIAKALTDK